MEGWWTPATTWSPPGAAIRTVSSPVFPSDPGAPFGQSKTVCGSAATAPNQDAHTRHASGKLQFDNFRIVAIKASNPAFRLLKIVGQAALGGRPAPFLLLYVDLQDRSVTLGGDIDLARAGVECH